MAEEQNGDRRLSLSEQRVKEIVDNAMLRLQIELGKAYAAKDDLKRLEDTFLVQVKSRQQAEETLERRLDEQRRDLDGLEKDKAGRDAVTQFKKWLTGGALLATVFMMIQVAISIWLVTRGSKP